MEKMKDLSAVNESLNSAIYQLQQILLSDLTNLEVLVRKDRTLVPVYEDGNKDSVGLLQKGPELLVIEVANFKNAGNLFSSKQKVE
jgi:hypothetical protein